MKTIKYNIFFLFILLLPACERDLHEININPNAPEITNPNHLFTNSLLKGNTSYLTDVQVEQWSLMNWTMTMATFGGLESNRIFEMPGQIDGLWRELYVDALMNAEEIIKITSGQPAEINKTQIARIWKAFLFQQLTDVYGDIPYSEALQGLDYSVLTPAYDRQEAIYQNLINELETACQKLDASKAGFTAAADLIYQGDIEHWRAFGYSLQFRMAMRISGVDPARSRQVIELLQSRPIITSNQASALFPFNLNEQKNPIAEVIQKGEDANRTYPSALLINQLRTTQDPRLKVLARPTLKSVLFGNPEYIGVPGLVSNDDPLWNNYDPSGMDVSQIGDWFLRADAKGVHLSYAEVCFLQAEAALKGWWPGDALDYLKAGARADMEALNQAGDSPISETEIATYLASLTSPTIEDILTQKWICNAFRNGYEIFAEYRRTGYPVLIDPLGQPLATNRIPKRLRYPANEAALNTLNYNEAIAHQGPDTPETPLWWDID